MCAHPRTSEQRPFLYHDNHWAKDVGRKQYGATRMQQKKAVDPKSNSVIKDASQVPDGGWGWLVVLGVAVSNMTTQALVSVFGFLFSQRLGELGIATSGATVILSVQSAFLNLSGLFTGSLIRKFSYQTVALTGGILMMAGLLLTTLADSLVTYIITYSISTGLGLGCLYPSTFVAVNSYFSSKKGIAVGWSVTGTGIGQMLLPILVNYLLEEFGFRGTILILAGLSGHAMVGALLYQPVAWHMKKKKNVSSSSKKTNGKSNVNLPAIVVEVKDTVEGVADNDEEGVKSVAIRRLSEPRCRASASLYSIELSDDESVSQQAKSKSDSAPEATKSTTSEEGFWRRLVSTLDYDLLKSGSFLVVIVGTGVIFTANTLFQMLFPLFLESLQYTRSEVATCMVALSAFDIVGRPVLPYIIKFAQMRAKTVFFFSAFFSAFARSCLATQDSMIPILVLSGICGLFRSAIITNMNLTVAEQTSAAKLPTALGLQMVSKGIAILSLGPLVGLLRDKTHSYTLCIHVLSLFFLILPFSLYFIQRICTRTKS